MSLRVTGWTLVCAVAIASCGDSAASGTATEGTDTSGATGTTGAVDTSESSATPTSATDSLDTSATLDGTTTCVALDDGPLLDVSPCDGDCPSNAFDVEHITGLNYTSRDIHILAPTCVGPTCPASFDAGTYRAEPIGPCEETAEALASARGPETFCKLAALGVTFGLEIGFTQPPEPDSITLERPRIDDPLQTEPYAWRAGIVEIRGPATEYNGDYFPGIGSEPDLLINARNLACLENLESLGIPYDPDDLDAACAATFVGRDGETMPLRMRIDDVLRPGRGRLDSRFLGCSTPATGVDTCCSTCDHELSVAVAKYGADGGGQRRSPNGGTALECDPDGDRLVQCRDFSTDVDRNREVQSFVYAWNGCAQEWPLPPYDKIRETHPDDRPEGIEPEGKTCATDGDCASGQECIGSDMQTGNACKTGTGCANRTCRPEWFVACRTDPSQMGGPGYCVDTRHRSTVAGACLEATAAFDGVGGNHAAGERLVHCDTMTDGNLTAAECCQDSLGNEDVCDPLFQSGVVPIDRHDRDEALPETALCTCTDPGTQPAACAAVIDASCEAPVGSGSDPGGVSQPGEYAQRAVRMLGGVRYDEELDGFDLRIALTGNLQRSLAESCAQSANLIDRRSVADGWLANENFLSASSADYDRAMCSDSTYVLHFAGPGDPEHVVSEMGSTLEGKQRYVIQTVEFLVVPSSGFPSNNLFIDGCSSFSLRFSNKYDLSEDNQRKVSIWELEDQGGEWVPVQRIAGGRDCDPDATAGDVQLGAIPCLVVGVEDHLIGKISVHIDHDRYGQLLQAGTRYRIVVPGLDDPADISDPAAYVEAFHDVCGMPLITGNLPEPEYLYEVLIDGDCP